MELGEGDDMSEPKEHIIPKGYMIETTTTTFEVLQDTPIRAWGTIRVILPEITPRASVSESEEP